MRDDGDRVVASAVTLAGPVVLTAEVSPEGVSWAVGGVELARTPLSALSTETAGGFVGTTFGPYATGPVGAGVRLVAWTQEDRE